MRIFCCPVCGGPVFFDDLVCHCGAEIAFDPEAAAFRSDALQCANRRTISCNWVAADGPDSLCRACAMTSVVPDQLRVDNVALWAEAERAKRWVLATLARWGWFAGGDAGARPEFHLLAEETSAGVAPVTMGHQNGLVTINVAEADPAHIVARREELGERLRTMIGHFRHELAHFLFERLASDPDFVLSFRETFGDERADYGAALDTHYRDGPRPDWQAEHITPYAASHPHEDWAECVAHLLHLADITDSFVAAGLSADCLPAPDYDPYREGDAERLVSIGAEIGIALNHANRSMGLSDIYPFVLTPPIRGKLAFAHRALAPASLAARTTPGV